MWCDYCTQSPRANGYEEWPFLQTLISRGNDFKVNLKMNQSVRATFSIYDTYFREAKCFWKIRFWRNIWYRVSHAVEFLYFLTLHLNISLDNDQLDAHLLYFTTRPLQSSTCFEHYMLIIRRLNCIDAASGIVTLSQWPSDAQVERELLNTSTTILYMFRALYAHHQEAELYWCNIWYRHSQ